MVELNQVYNVIEERIESLKRERDSAFQRGYEAAKRDAIEACEKQRVRFVPASGPTEHAFDGGWISGCYNCGQAIAALTPSIRKAKWTDEKGNTYDVDMDGKVGVTFTPKGEE